VPAERAVELARKALACESADRVRTLMREGIDSLLPEFLIGDGGCE
jgi:hypothetical protein